MRALLAIVPLTLASKADIYGLCNQYHEPVHFVNTEKAANNCIAAPGKSCQTAGTHKHRAFIPKAEHPQDFSKHHMSVRTGTCHGDKASDLPPFLQPWAKATCYGGHFDKEVVLFKKDDAKPHGGVFAGSHFADAQRVADTSEQAWNVVVHPDFSISLYQTANWRECPPPPPPPCDSNKITQKSGVWAILSDADAAGVTVSYSHGTKHEDSSTVSHQFAESLTASVEAGFTAGSEGGFGAKVTVSSQTSWTVGHSETELFGEEWTESSTYTSPHAGTIWQWQWSFENACSKKSVSHQHSLITTRGRWDTPCCLPGLARDPTNYTAECTAVPNEKVYNLCQHATKPETVYV